MHLSELKVDLCEWGSRNHNILAIGLVGSYARREEGPTSDVDLISIAYHPSRLLDDVAWVGRFGRLTSKTVEDFGLVQSLRCISDTGIELELGITSQRWCAPPIDRGTSSVINDGIDVIFDPTGRLENAIEWVSSNRPRRGQ